MRDSHGLVTLVDYANLEAFVTVARSGGFSAAARKLHRSQPGVTRQVQQLERELEATLLVRGHGACRLTSEGERALAWAEDALARQQQLLADIRGEHVALRGELRIAASTTPGEFLVPELVAGFVRAHPEVRPRLAIADSSSVEQAVRTHAWYIGFVGAIISGQGLRYRPVVTDEVVRAVRVNHAFAVRGSADLDDLQDQPFLDREGGSGTMASVMRTLAERSLRLPRVQTVMSLGTSTAIVSAAERGLGLGWVSSLALACRDPRRVRTVRLRGIPIERILSMVDDSGRPLTPAAAAFAATVSAWRPLPCPDDAAPEPGW